MKLININIKKSVVNSSWGDSGANKTPNVSQAATGKKFRKYIPYKKRANDEKQLIKDNIRTLGGMCSIGAASSAVKGFIGSLSISNKRALNLPLGVHKLEQCLCDGKNHQFLYLCDTFKGLPHDKRVNVAKALQVCRSCLLRHSGECRFLNRHSCSAQDPADKHNSLLCPDNTAITVGGINY